MKATSFLWSLILAALLVPTFDMVGQDAQTETAADTAWDCASVLLDGIDKFEFLYRINIAHQVSDFDPKVIYTIPMAFHILGEDTQALSAVGMQEVRLAVEQLDQQLREQQFVTRTKGKKAVGQAVKLAIIKEHGSPRPAMFYHINHTLAYVDMPDMEYMSKLSDLCLDPSKYLNVFVIQEMTGLSATYCSEFNIILIDQAAFLTDPLWSKS